MQAQIVNQRLYRIRNIYGLSQKEFASLFNISHRTYQRIEHGQQSPTVSFLFEVAKYFKLSADFFLSEFKPISNVESSSLYMDCDKLHIHKLEELIQELSEKIKNLHLVSTGEQAKNQPHYIGGLKTGTGNTAFYEMLEFDALTSKSMAHSQHPRPDQVLILIECAMLEPTSVFLTLNKFQLEHLAQPIYIISVSKLKNASLNSPLIDVFSAVYKHNHIDQDCFLILLFKILSARFNELRLLPLFSIKI